MQGCRWTWRGLPHRDILSGLVQQGNALGEGLGLQYLLAAGLLTGLLQIAWGYLRLAHQMRFVPQPVMAGFVNALAILILLAQLPQLGLDRFHPEATAVEAGQFPAVWALMLLTPPDPMTPRPVHRRKKLLEVAPLWILGEHHR